MAKSSWKFLNTNSKEISKFLIDFFLPKKYKGRQIVRTYTKNITINYLNYMHRYFLYQGKFEVKKKFSMYHIGFNLGQFLKSRKPFYFRSKKKKKK